MKRIIYIVLISTFTLCVSCSDLLETNPKDSIPGDKVFSTLNGNETLLQGAYEMMQSSSFYGCDMICLPEILADNCALSPGGYIYKLDYRNATGSGCNIWVEAYQVIAVTNDIINSIDKVSIDESQTGERDRIKGEALFIRGMMYFDLLRAYAREPGYLVSNFDLGVPLVTGSFTSMGPDAYPSRNDIYGVWTQVESDLNEAFSLLQNNDANNFPQRPTSYAAKALLARAYLYESKWQDAVTAATWVIDQNNPVLYDGNYKDLFAKGVETIYQLSFSSQEALGASSLHAMYAVNDGWTGNEGSGYISNGIGSGDGELIVANNLLNQFEPGDKRLTLIREAYFNGDPTQKVWWTGKFNSWQGTFGQDNIPLIRISEMYLIRAEASLKLPTPDYTTARSDIDALREARGLSASTAGNGTLAAAVQKERRLELCFEGHRFFDLKRLGLDITKEPPSVTLPYTDFRVVAGIPQVEMDANKNLVNNPGY